MRFGLALAIAWLCLLGQALAESRVALVIGNGAYRHITPVAKARSDVQAYAEALRGQGYFVQEGYDLDASGLSQAVANFVDGLQPGDTALFVFAGQGFGDGAVNYLAGVEAPDKARVDELIRASLPLRNGRDGLLDQVADKGAGLAVAIIDAGHGAVFHPPAGERTLNLRPATAPGAFVIYSASEGQTALERVDAADKSANSVFARAILPSFKARLPLADAVAATRDAVRALAAQAKQQQVPAVFFDPKQSQACLFAECRSNAPADAPEGVRAAMLMASPEGKITPVVSTGVVTWSAAAPDPGRGEGATARADIHIPSLKLHAVMTLTRNLSPRRPWTHLVTLTMISEDGSDFKAAKDFAAPQMRRNEPPSTTTLLGGAGATDTGGTHEFALSADPGNLARNVEALRSNDWFDFPILFADGLLAKLTFEKGALGEKCVAATLVDPR